MNATTMKLLTAGSLALAIVSVPVLAQEAKDSAAKEVADKKEEGKTIPLTTRMFVAIDKFDNKAGVDANQFETIRARVQEAVVGTRKFEVLEREQMKNALSEQNLLAAGLTNGQDENAPQAGKMKAAGYVIYGNILFYGIDQSQVVIGGAGASNIRTKVELQIKITNAETGKILAQKSIIGIGQESRVATSESATQGNVREQSERMAVADAAHYVVDALRDVCYPARIVKIGKKECLVNMTDAEVKLGDLFDVVEAGEEMRDPDTGASLGCDGEVVGRVRITRPGAKTSACKGAEYWDEDEKEMCETSIKDLDKNAKYIVRRIGVDRLNAEKRLSKEKKGAGFGDKF